MDNISVSQIGVAIASLVNSQHLKGSHIVVIGHSVGSSAAMYSTKFYPPGRIPFTGIILVEPPMIDRDVFNRNRKDRERQTGYISKALVAQKNTWPTREAAREWLRSRSPWKTWDDRMLDRYKYALRENSKNSPEVIAKCSKKQEAYSFLDFEPTFEALDQIASVCKETPIHVLFGGINDMVPRYSQDTVVDATKGRAVASVRRIPGTGHNIVQQHLDILAENLWILLKENLHSTKL